jgi:hypothetical protein
LHSRELGVAQEVAKAWLRDRAKKGRRKRPGQLAVPPTPTFTPLVEIV